MTNLNKNGLSNEVLTESKIWFTNFVNELRADEALLELDVLPDEKKTFYEDAINGNVEGLLDANRKSIEEYYIRKILYSYIHRLQSTNAEFNSLGVDHGINKVLVWAEIEDDNFEQEKLLILAEAHINNKFKSTGFRIDTTIVEKSDNLSVPYHYETLLDSNSKE